MQRKRPSRLRAGCLWLIVLMGLLSCLAAAGYPLALAMWEAGNWPEQTFEGHYWMQFEVSSFVADGAGCPSRTNTGYWLQTEHSAVWFYNAVAALPGPSPDVLGRRIAHVRFVGQLSPPALPRAARNWVVAFRFPGINRRPALQAYVSVAPTVSALGEAYLQDYSQIIRVRQVLTVEPDEACPLP